MMNFENLGFFTKVKHSENYPHGVLFAENEYGEDFYDIVAKHTSGTFFLIDRSGRVIGVTGDLSLAFPDGMGVIRGTGTGLADLETKYRTGCDMRYVNGVIEEHIPTIEERRARASLPKDDFILAALDAGVLTEADAEEATSGWPTGWDNFFIGQPDRDRIEAKARWASATTVARNAPLIERLRVYKDLTPEQVDALFRINV